MSPQQIRELREKMGLSMKAFGAEVGVSEAQVSRWEAGISHPPYKRWELLNKLAEEHSKEQPA